MLGDVGSCDGRPSDKVVVFNCIGPVEVTGEKQAACKKAT